MKDKDGFTIKCKWTDWQICDDRDNKDFVCCGPFPRIHCHGDDGCQYYEPDRKEDDDA